MTKKYQPDSTKEFVDTGTVKSGTDKKPGKRIASVRSGKLQQLMKVIKYQFNDVHLLEESLTHRSKHSNNNERLEYLGDSILGFIVAEQLFIRFPDASEGELSRSRSKLVKGETLASLARRLELGEYLLLGPGELKSGGYRRNSTLADTFEAVMGAIYLDGGLDAVRAFVLRQINELLDSICIDDSLKDPKTLLQEYLQSRKLALPVYSVVSTEGSVHEQVFTVECVVAGLEVRSIGIGSSRRKAEQVAAKKVFDTINPGVKQ